MKRLELSLLISAATLMTSHAFADAMKNEGAAVVAGKLDDSPLIARVYLPVADEEHMPPEDKEQLTAEETAVLAFWISSGAKATGLVGDLKPDAKAAAALNHVIGNLPKAVDTVTKADAPKADPAMDKLVAETIGQVEKGGASLMPRITTVAAHTDSILDVPRIHFSAVPTTSMIHCSTRR